jgi:hypothetical protein
VDLLSITVRPQYRALQLRILCCIALFANIVSWIAFDMDARCDEEEKAVPGIPGTFQRAVLVIELDISNNSRAGRASGVSSFSGLVHSAAGIVRDDVLSTGVVAGSPPRNGVRSARPGSTGHLM